MLLVLKYIRLARSLSGAEHTVILLASLIFPLGFPFVEGLISVGWCWHWSCVEWARVIFHVGAWLFSVRVIALAGRVGRSRVDAKLNRMSSGLNDSIKLLRDDHERKITGNQRLVRNLDDRVSKIHQALIEAGIDLPPPVVSAGGDHARITITGREGEGMATPPNRLVRFRLMISRHLNRLRRWFLKWVLAKELDQE